MRCSMPVRTTWTPFTPAQQNIKTVRPAIDATIIMKHIEKSYHVHYWWNSTEGQFKRKLELLVFLRIPISAETGVK